MANTMQVLGAMWYLLSIERQYTCWVGVCTNETGTEPGIPSCDTRYLDCRTTRDPTRIAWLQHSSIRRRCLLPDAEYEYGLFSDALNLDRTGVPFVDKYLYCLWWGFRNLRYSII
jgi:cyclic nucleotide gated channel, plant